MIIGYYISLYFLCGLLLGIHICKYHNSDNFTPVEDFESDDWKAIFICGFISPVFLAYLIVHTIKEHGFFHFLVKTRGSVAQKKYEIGKDDI